MADTPVEHVHSNMSPYIGLSLSMPHEQIDVAINHTTVIWWPQLCRSARTQAVIDVGMFEEGWFDEKCLLDMHNPAFWKILNALGCLYNKLRARYSNDEIKAFCVRWQVSHNENMIHLRAEGKKNGKLVGPAKGFHIKGPPSGWLDFQMKIDTLKKMCDARDET